MKLIDVYKRIIELGEITFQTRDIASYLNINNDHASQILRRLNASGLIVKLAHGRWGLTGKIDILKLPELLTSPFPSYISLQTALYHQGIISQIPAVTYAISLARTRCYKTAIGTVSIHHVQPNFFCGFEIDEKTGIKIATPEKAIIDIFYLNPAKTRLFSNLPELELPEDFNRDKARGYAEQISSLNRRTMVLRRLSELI